MPIINTDDLSLAEVSTTIAKVGAGIGIIWAGWKFLLRQIWPRMIKHFYAQHIGGQLFREFGEDAARKIKDALTNNRMSTARINARLDVICREMKIGLYICDATGKCIWSNQYLADLFGMDSTEVLGYGWLLGIADDERERSHQRWMFSVKNDTPYRDEYHALNRRTGQKTLVMTEAEPIRTEDGKTPTNYIGILKEISNK